MTIKERELKYEIKKLKATIKRKEDKIKKFEYVERDNRILRDKVKMLELEHERI
jgi:hypothetical protein